MTKKSTKRDRHMPIMRPHAAGMDIGAEEIYVAIPGDHDDDPVRCFGTFTCDLCALADWLQQCGSETVAWRRPVFTGSPSFRFWNHEVSRYFS